MEHRTSIEKRGNSGRGTRKPAVVSTVAVVAAAHQEPGRSVPLARTRATYRALMMRGLANSEAATLTGYLAGIPVGQVWTLHEVNQLLFLRELDRRGSWAAGTNAGEDPPSL